MDFGDLKARVERLEEHHNDLEKAVVELNKASALLHQTVDRLTEAEENRRSFREKSVLFVVGGFLSALVAWIVRGGLGS